MDIQVVTLFPEMVATAARFGVCGRALARGLVCLGVQNPRQFASDPHQSVDDRPYGGGPGMVLKVEPFRSAIGAARNGLRDPRVVFLSPQGRRFDQDLAREMATWPALILVAGRYEGFDQRLIDSEGGAELSIGDFVLSGGEIAALAVIDALVRLMPGALGDDLSSQVESFSDNLLDCPQYTRPEVIDDMAVPAVLLAGNHDAIRRWRLKQALGRTRLRRPDLLQRRTLNDEERELLREFLGERGEQGERAAADNTFWQ